MHLKVFQSFMLADYIKPQQNTFKILVLMRQNMEKLEGVNTYVSRCSTAQ